jgi:hypothetical protein
MRVVSEYSVVQVNAPSGGTVEYDVGQLELPQIKASASSNYSSSSHVNQGQDGYARGKLEEPSDN